MKIIQRLVIMLMGFLLYSCLPLGEEEEEEFEQLIPEFHIEAVSGGRLEKGRAVDFADNTRGPVNSWQWEFENGIPATSTDQHPKGIVFNEAGTFMVTLRVNNGERDFSFSNTITIAGRIPDVDFTTSSAYVVGQPICFEGSSTEEAVSWSWDFTGAKLERADEQNSCATYYDKGEYEVVLTVGTSEEEFGQVRKNITVDWSGECGEQVMDIDGNVYPVVRIGNQCWMAENLKVSHYKNGDEIPRVRKNSEWSYLESGAYTFYQDNEAYNEVYGKHYNWFAVADPRGICPEGWRVPSEDDFNELKYYIKNKWWNETPGGVLKAEGTEYWRVPNTGATNITGFSALPAGHAEGESATGMGTQAAFWLSTSMGDPVFGHFFNLYYSDIKIRYDYSGVKTYGFSCRCMKN